MKLRVRVTPEMAARVGEMVDVDLDEATVCMLAGHNLRDRQLMANVIRGWTDRKGGIRDISDERALEWVAALLRERPYALPKDPA